MANEQQVGPCSPFFIVEDVEASLAFYTGTLGFDCRFSVTEPDTFFAIVGRESAQIMLKAVGDRTGPLPNSKRHAEAPWDAFVYVPAPDALAAELTSRGALFHRALGDTDDGLRGFEIADPDGYVCFFGCPR